MKKNPDITLVLPCFNEAEHIETSVSRIFDVLDKTPYHWEVIFIDDKSTDTTREKLKHILKKHYNHEVKVLFHEHNKGRGYTVSEGIHAAQSSIVGYIDIDCEIDPEYMPKFIESIQSGYDIACANRMYKISASGVIRAIASKMYIWISGILLDSQPMDTEAGYKFFLKKSILPVLDKTRDTKWFWDTEIMMLAQLQKLKITYIPTIFIRRSDKTSTVNLFSDTIDYLKKLIDFRKRLHHEKINEY